MNRKKVRTTPTQPSQPNRREVSLLSEQDLYLFNEGTHFHLYEKLGAHHLSSGGTYFAVWAPNADRVSVVGDFNGWGTNSSLLKPRGQSGIWEGVFENVEPGALYKFCIRSRDGKYQVEKADPFAFHSEEPPRSASIVWDLTYQWQDTGWMAKRANRNSLEAPISIYEMHVGSWRRKDGRYLPYRELTPYLVDYLKGLQFTHVELLPIMEHPFGGSWGYQTTGYFTPTSRFGSPQDFMYLVDQLHQNDIGVILDWVPSHFPNDEHGLSFFDGSHLFEHADPRQGFHPDWKSCVFNYGRNEVRSFLISSALFWLDYFHADGLRVDAVASMLYLDYSRKEGEWIPNRYGGRENLEALSFLRLLNEEVYRRFPDVQTMAEESTAWPMVSRPTYLGGLGFGMKWDMGWMHDTLQYFGHEPVHRKYHLNNLTFRMLYAFNENFVLPLSHDEVVHGKGSLLGKMPGDEWQQFANLRTLYGYMYGQSAKKLLFMGSEFGQWNEWNHDGSLDWHLLESDAYLHAGLYRWVADLNQVYRAEPALHRADFVPEGFEWIDCTDHLSSILSFLRKVAQEQILVVCNFTPVPRHAYRLGVPVPGRWRELLNSDAEIYGGSGMGNLGNLQAEEKTAHGQPYSLQLTLPPLGVLFLKPDPCS